MFENIVIRRSGDTPDGMIDAGQIAEALLFYQSAHLLLEHGSLVHLLQTLGPDNLLRLMRDHGVKVTYSHESMGTQVDNITGLNVYNFHAYSLAGDQKTGPLKNKSKIIDFIFQRALGKSQATRKSARDFYDIAEMSEISKGFGHEKGLPGVARGDLTDLSYVKEAVQLVVRHYVPEYEFPSNWHFQIVDWKDGFLVDSDLRFEELTALCQQQPKFKDVKITPARILLELSDGSMDLRLASSYASEYSTTHMSSLIAQARLQNLVDICSNQSEQIQLFQSITLDKSASIREAINSNERSFEDFFGILEEADKFKEWLHSVNPDTGLMRQYNDELLAKTGLDKLGPKSVRFVAATGLGLLVDIVFPTGLGTVTGVAVGAGDTFLLDKLAKGWNPSHFVSGPLKDFVQPD